MVFLGGCATGLLLTDPAAPEVRPTRDVDVITELGLLAEYHRLADALRAAGFVEDQGPGAPLQAPHHHVVQGVRGIEVPQLTRKFLRLPPHAFVGHPSKQP